MAAETHLRDPKTYIAARITRAGEVVVGPLEPSEIAFASLALDNTAYNLVTPKAGFDIIILGAVASALRDVGANGTQVDIYQASGLSETTVDESILRFDLIKQGDGRTPNIYARVPEGKWINAKCDDATVSVTLFWFYRRAKDGPR